MRHQPVQLVPGTVTEACDFAAARNWGSANWRLVLVPEDLKPGGTYMLVGTWAQRLNPDALHARLDELGIRPAHPSGWAQ